MAYDHPTLRDDWLRHHGSYLDNRVTSAEQNIVPHDFVGAQPGYQGALTQHGETCLRTKFYHDGANGMLRYFLRQQSPDDDAACEITAACNFHDSINNPWAYVALKVPDIGHANGTVVCPDPVDLNDGDYVTLPDGAVSVTFHVDKSGTYDPGYDATNVRWLVQGLTTAAEVADALRALVQAASNLDLTTDDPGPATVKVINRDHDQDATGGFPTNSPILKSGLFTVTGMAGGDNTTNIAQGYMLGFQPDGVGVFLSSCRHDALSGGNYGYNTVADTEITGHEKDWCGLRLTAHRIGDAMRLRCYYMVGREKVETMYTNPSWTLGLDVLHLAGDQAMYAGSSITGQVLSGGFDYTTPGYTGRAGFGIYGGQATPVFWSSVRVVRGVVI